MTIANSQLPTMHITLDSTRLSDLFFNFEHPEFDNACRGGEDYTAQRNALYRDAESFLIMLTGDHGLAILFVDDFFARL